MEDKFETILIEELRNEGERRYNERDGGPIVAKIFHGIACIIERVGKRMKEDEDDF